MQITFLGTAAAESYPNAFCDCANCTRARELGGSSFRLRTAALVNDNLLIDLGPDIMSASFRFGVPLTKVRWCLQTHAHADHFDPSHLLSRSPGYGVPNAPRLHLYASAATLDYAARLLANDCAPHGLMDPEAGGLLNLELHAVRAYETFEAGPYNVTAYPATHDPTVEPLVYAVESVDGCLFYGLDTGVLREEVWSALARRERPFSVLILDHVYGEAGSGSDHLNGPQFRQHVARMRQEGLLAPGCRVIAAHVSHSNNPPHQDLAALVARHGYEAAFDGMTV